ncbi:PilZ domain-containing protein [Allosphingosinicella sp.]|uniref:PilZ domain-containing protein n=1 Tax=Allosphingosinicella sp. TaxID=2823234 RepID=UPI0037833F7B
MQIAARIEPIDAVNVIEAGESRSAPRRRANQMASLRQRKAPPEMIQVVDISAMGCGFRSRWPFVAGTRVWLSLPGLETWAATIAWYEDGKGGLQFENPLHPLVAERYASGL